MEIKTKKIKEAILEFIKANKKIKKIEELDDIPDEFDYDVIEILLKRMYRIRDKTEWGFDLTIWCWIEDCPEEYDDEDPNICFEIEYFISDNDGLTAIETTFKLMYELEKAIRKANKTLWKEKVK